MFHTLSGYTTFGSTAILEQPLYIDNFTFDSAKATTERLKTSQPRVYGRIIATIGEDTVMPGY
jgi:hypothetical protein